jgi:3-deoxy-D-manno-octulosonate 8-phosphate phosphatase (KDO 8-P phosphatase)
MRSALPPGTWTPELSARAKALRWLLLDVDGVLTDGRLWFDEKGEALKGFDVRDGHGIKLLREHGVEVAILSARTSPVVSRRAAGLGIVEVLQGEDDKKAAFDRFLERRHVGANEIAYLADDLQDLAVLGACGLAAAPGDAVADVRARVDYVTEAGGGGGAVRELAERILAARGIWASIVARFAGEAPPDSGEPADS